MHKWHNQGILLISDGCHMYFGNFTFIAACEIDFCFACDGYWARTVNFLKENEFFILNCFFKKKFCIQKIIFEDSIRRSDVSLYLFFLAVVCINVLRIFIRGCRYYHFFRVHNLNFCCTNMKVSIRNWFCLLRDEKINRIQQHLNSIYSEQQNRFVRHYFGLHADVTETNTVAIFVHDSNTEEW